MMDQEKVGGRGLAVECRERRKTDGGGCVNHKSYLCNLFIILNDFFCIYILM